MSHTPGPWKFQNPTETELFIGRSGHIVIAQVFSDAERDRTSASVVLLEEAKANAHLIAAAPDMLEALKNALFLLKSHQIFESTVSCEETNDAYQIRNEIEDAIAKATGE